MADPVDEAAELLYGLPLDEFTAARNAAAKELRDRGLGAESDEVKALAKPSVAAWAVNQLTRRRHADLDEFLEAAAAAREAQLGGGSGRPRCRPPPARRPRRARRLGPRRARREGVRGGRRQDPPDARGRGGGRPGGRGRPARPAGKGARAGRVRDARRAREAGGLAGRSRPGRTQDAAAASKALAEARAQLREAEDELRGAQAEERQAHKRWQQAQGDAAEAAERVEKVRRELERLRGARP